MFVDECKGFHFIDMDYDLEDGTVRDVSSYAYTTTLLSLGLDNGVVSDVDFTHTVTFDQCDPEVNDTCEVSIHTAPK